jgi:hypothetical protein
MPSWKKVVVSGSDATLNSVTATAGFTGSLLGNASTATSATTANATTAALTAGTFLTSAGTFNGSTARTFAVDATDANTASKVVARNASGNFSAGTITATLSGNASTATSAATLTTARSINGTSFNGSANITTANWGTTRTITIGATGKSVNGSGNVAWSLAEIGAQAALTNPVTGTGVNQRVALWSGTTTQTSDANLTFDGSTFNITGTLTATRKSFIIDHPTKPGKRLQYGVLEGPEHSVYVRGRLRGETRIELPDHWHALVHEDSITVNLTAVGKAQDLWVDEITDTYIIVAGNDVVNCFYSVFAERKDIEKLVTEFDKE